MPQERINKKKLNNNPFSIIIDESTDIGTIKTMCICVRFFNPMTKKIESIFYSLVEVFKDSEFANKCATAQKLYAEVIASFKDEKANLDNVIGFASGGCNTMMGAYNSVAKRFLEDFSGVMIQKFICHSLALCASEAC